MKFGFLIPGYGSLSSPDNLIALARAGEEMGFEIFAFSDHIVIPKSIEPAYPYSVSGQYYGGSNRDYVEMLITLSFLISQTSKARLLTSVMIMPHRPPMLTAKMLTTIDVLSKGRLEFGYGIGWMREEFEATGAPPFEERGTVSDEYIMAIKELWTSDDPTFEGKYCRFSDVDFLPRTVQRPHPPIWIGGESPPALRRAARLADVWYPLGVNPRFPMGTPEQMAAGISRMRLNAEEIGRDPSEIGLAYFVYQYSPEPVAPNGERQRFTGAPEQIAGDIKVWQDLGVEQMTLNLVTDWNEPLEKSLARMEGFATKVRPLVEG